MATTKESNVPSLFAYSGPVNFPTREMVMEVGKNTVIIIISGLFGGVENAVETLTTFCARDLAN